MLFPYAMHFSILWKLHYEQQDWWSMVQSCQMSLMMTGLLLPGAQQEEQAMSGEKNRPVHRHMQPDKGQQAGEMGHG